MALTGDAKRAYQAQYMRKKRAGEPTRKPRLPKEWAPTYSIVSEIESWVRRGTRKPELREITEGLELTLPEFPEYDRDDIPDFCRAHDEHRAAVMPHVLSDPAWQEAFRRYRAHKEKLKAGRERRKKSEERRPCPGCGRSIRGDRELCWDCTPKHCAICDRSDRKVAGNWSRHICLECAGRAVALLERKGNDPGQAFELDP
jgi:hypothetical protein